MVCLRGVFGMCVEETNLHRVGAHQRAAAHSHCADAAHNVIGRGVWHAGFASMGKRVVGRRSLVSGGAVFGLLVVVVSGNRFCHHELLATDS